MHDISYALRAACVLTLLLCGSCGSSPAANPDAAGNGNSALRTSVLTNLADNIVLPNLRAFAARTSELEAALGGYANDRSESNATSAKSTFAAAMSAWQRIELAQFGPTGPRPVRPGGTTPGGENLRDEIYAWPVFDRCSVDQETVRNMFDDATMLAASPVRSRGLAAIEYLLYTTSQENNCLATATINTNGAWMSLRGADGSGLRERRAKQALALCRNLRTSADRLVSQWTAFAVELKQAGLGSQTFVSSQAGLNAVNEALFYLELVTRDVKVGRAAGLYECPQMTCPESLESRESRLGKESVVTNLRAFEQLLFGLGTTEVDGPGFDDLLVAANHPEIATSLRSKIAAAVSAAESVNASFPDAITTERDSMMRLYLALKEITDLIKTQFVTVLDLELPMQLEGDND